MLFLETNAAVLSVVPGPASSTTWNLLEMKCLDPAPDLLSQKLWGRASNVFK